MAEILPSFLTVVDYTIDGKKFNVTSICPHCEEEFETEVEIEPSDFESDRD